MKASIDSGNNLLQELVSWKRASSDDKGESLKRRESVTATQKASILSPHKEEPDSSEIEHIRSVNTTDASYANNLSLFGDEIDEVEEIVLDDM